MKLMEISNWHSTAMAYASNCILMHSLTRAVVGLVMEALKVVLPGAFEIAKITPALHLFFHAQEMFQDVKGYSSQYL